MQVKILILSRKIIEIKSDLSKTSVNKCMSGEPSYFDIPIDVRELKLILSFFP